MRASRREVNIFNMSLLDILCGALGAFCFLTLTLFPYYGKKESEAGVEKGIARQRLDEAQSKLKALEAELDEQAETQQLRALERKVAEARQEAAALEPLEAKRKALAQKLETARQRGKPRNQALANAEADSLRQRLRTIERLMQRPRTGTADYPLQGQAFLSVLLPHPERGPAVDINVKPPGAISALQLSRSDGNVWISYGAVPGQYRFEFQTQPNGLSAQLGLHAYVCARAGCEYVGPQRLMSSPSGPLRGFTVDLSANGRLRVQ